ncbi:MAG: threonine synthase [Candidatus Methylomirabilis sp.]
MSATRWNGIIDRYREFLPVTDRTPVITLNEGNTPLVRAERLEAALGIEAEVYLKCEGLNPTGSFKDRGMTVAISKAVEEGARAVICASTGNTSASASAYAARAGLRAFVLIPEGKIALGKLSQAMIHGAQVLQIEGNFDQALRIVRQLSQDQVIALVNSVNPYRIEGQKSGAFEICDQLGRSPDYHFIPVGNAGNITAYWKGYQEYVRAARIKALPRMMGWQAEGAAPLVHGKVVERPETVATAIQIGNPASWNGALAAARESGGRIDMVSDREIVDAYRLLASTEGIFCELASAASVAGLIKFGRSNRWPKGAVVVCVLTGHGLKDPDAAIRLSQGPVTVKADPEAVLKLLSV